MIRNKKVSVLIFLGVYVVLSLLIIRGSMLVNRGYTFQPSIVEDSIRSLIQVPFALPTGEELTLFALFSSLVAIYGANKYINPKHYRNREEYGSAKWGNVKDLKAYIDKHADDNLLFSKNTKLALDKGRGKRNNNVFVVGGSGAGKSRFLVKPNLLQQHASYIITDPKGEMLRDTGTMFETAGYTIKVFDLYNMSESFKYNPFAYINNDEDILVLIDNLIHNTQAPDQKSNDPFWEKSEKALLQSLIAYIHYYVHEKEHRNFSTVLRLLEYAQSSDESQETDLDILMNETHATDPNNFAYRQYQIFKQSADKTRQSILISTSVRLSPFNIQAVSDLTAHDDMAIDELANEKTVIYILLSDTNQTYNFLVAMFLEQVFQRLYHINDFEQGLSYPVRLMLDEFANIGRINQFEQRLATMRSRKLSAIIITQDLSQIEAKYKNSWKSLIGNCDTFVYLGSNEKGTNEYVSKLLGKETIDTRNEGKSRGSSRSNSINHQKLGRELLTPDELGNLADTKNVTIIRGLDPFFDDKYPLHKHKRYTLLHDKPDDSNAFDYMSYKKKHDEQNQTDETEEQKLQEFTAMSEDELSLYKEIVARQITKRSDLSEEQKKAVAEQTNTELTGLYMTELSNQSFVDTIINERELVDIPSSENIEERV